MSTSASPSNWGAERLIRFIAYVCAFFVGALVAATLIIVALDGHPVGLLTVPVGAAVPVVLWGGWRLIQMRHKLKLYLSTTVDYVLLWPWLLIINPIPILRNKFSKPSLFTQPQRETVLAFTRSRSYGLLMVSVLAYAVAKNVAVVLRRNPHQAPGMAYLSMAKLDAQRLSIYLRGRHEIDAALPFSRREAATIVTQLQRALKVIGSKDASHIELAITFAQAMSAGLNEDLSGLDLRNINLSDADLRGFLWSEFTLWPTSLAADIRERSIEVRPGLYRINDRPKFASAERQPPGL